MTNHVRLSREVRFGLHGENVPHEAKGTTNGFSGNPALAGLVPFVVVTVTVAGPVDPSTGMLVNIKTIDLVVRDTAVALLRKNTDPFATGKLTVELFHLLRNELEAKRHVVDGVQLGLSPYLKFAVDREDAAMVRMSQRFEFSAAHRLHSSALSEAENWEVFGRCNNPNGHGHNYELEVTVAGPPDARTGVVIPVEQLQRIVNERVIDVFDHKHLNLDCAEFAALNPTVENIARILYGRLKGHIPAPAKLATVRVWETPKTMCEYEE
jgi:6-pyruvoyltetrahydropterin/6-carboxytetrahydropterin synthase